MLFYMFFVQTLLCSLWSLRQKTLRVFPFGLVVVALFYNITTNSFNKKKITHSTHSVVLHETKEHFKNADKIL